VISEEGEQLGVMTTDKAIALALEAGLDLVEVSPSARPPVCRIMDYGKYKYEQNKRAKQSKKKQHFVQVKEVKFRPKTEEHDYQFKKRHAEEFLKKMNKVKFTVIFRGRELDHTEMGMRILRRVAEELSEVGTVEVAARSEGRLMTMMMAPIPKTPGSRPKKTDRAAESAKGSSGGAEQVAGSPTDTHGSPVEARDTSKDTPSAGTEGATPTDTETPQANIEREGQNAEDQNESGSEKEIS
jgi:translation initiation factor IF-3